MRTVSFTTQKEKKKRSVDCTARRISGPEHTGTSTYLAPEYADGSALHANSDLYAMSKTLLSGILTHIKARDEMAKDEADRRTKVSLDEVDPADEFEDDEEKPDNLYTKFTVALIKAEPEMFQQATGKSVKELCGSAVSMPVPNVVQAMAKKVMEKVKRFLDVPVGEQVGALRKKVVDCMLCGLAVDPAKRMNAKSMLELLEVPFYCLLTNINMIVAYTNVKVNSRVAGRRSRAGDMLMLSETDFHVVAVTFWLSLKAEITFAKF